MSESVIGVEGMSCNHCKMSVEQALKKLSGVQEALVNLEAKNVRVTYDQTKVDLAALKGAISEAGYQPL